MFSQTQLAFWDDLAVVIGHKWLRKVDARADDVFTDDASDFESKLAGMMGSPRIALLL